MVRSQCLAGPLSSDEDNLEQRVRQLRKQHDSDPLTFFNQVLEAIWLESDDDDIEFLWRHRLRNAPWWAQDALLAFERVLGWPPDDLCDHIEEHAGRVVTAEENSAASRRACIDWVRKQLELLRSIEL